MKRGQNRLLFGKHRIQYPGVQKHEKNRDEPKNAPTIFGNGWSEKSQDGFNNPVIAFLVFRFSDNRKRDLDGACATVADSLVRAGILPDDDTQRISGICLSSVKVPKGQEGVDIMLVETW